MSFSKFWALLPDAESARIEMIEMVLGDRLDLTRERKRSSLWCVRKVNVLAAQTI